MNFLDVPQHNVTTSEGSVDLPILYHEASLVQAYFFVDYEKAAKALIGTGFVAARVPRGLAMVGLAMFDYRKTSIGPYGEAGLAVVAHPASEPPPKVPLVEPFRRPDRRKAGFAILHLPVSTPIACAAGRELWGYPKFVTPIDVKLDDERYHCAVHHPEGGAAIVTLDGFVPRGPPGFIPDLVLLSNRGDQHIRTLVEVECTARTGFGLRTKVEVGRSRHPMVRTLRALGLDGAAPFAVQTSTKFQSVLYAGQSIGRWAARDLEYAEVCS